MPTAETKVTEALTQLQASLTPEEESNLSKVLFPDIHTNSVTILKKPRELRPLTVKWARKLRAIMQPYAQKLDAATKNPNNIDVDLDLLDGIKGAAKIIAEVYGWEDVVLAIDEEDLTTGELQALVATQVQLQGENDFLLIPLRVAIMVMQAVEIQNRRYRNIFGGQQQLRL